MVDDARAAVACVALMTQKADLSGCSLHGDRSSTTTPASARERQSPGEPGCCSATTWSWLLARSASSTPTSRGRRACVDAFLGLIRSGLLRLDGIDRWRGPRDRSRATSRPSSVTCAVDAVSIASSALGWYRDTLTEDRRARGLRVASIVYIDCDRPVGGGSSTRDGPCRNRDGADLRRVVHVEGDRSVASSAWLQRNPAIALRDGTSSAPTARAHRRRPRR